MSEGRTYPLRLQCNNCGYSWVRDFPWGRDVILSVSGDLIDEGEKGGWEPIRCPNCGSYRVAKVFKTEK